MSDWHKAYYSQLVGLECVGVEILEEDGELWPKLKFRGKEEKVMGVKGQIIQPPKEVTIEVSRDEEGNGPGFLFGLEAPDFQRALPRG